MPGSRRTLTSIAAIAAATGLSVGPSYADSGNGGGGNIPVNERGNGATITLSSTTQTDYQSGAGNTGEAAWTAPPCWYGPLRDDAAFQKT